MSYGFKIMVEGDYACFTPAGTEGGTGQLRRSYAGSAGRYAEKRILETCYSVCDR